MPMRHRLDRAICCGAALGAAAGARCLCNALLTRLAPPAPADLRLWREGCLWQHQACCVGEWAHPLASCQPRSSCVQCPHCLAQPCQCGGGLQAQAGGAVCPACSRGGRSRPGWALRISARPSARQRGRARSDCWHTRGCPATVESGGQRAPGVQRRLAGMPATHSTRPRERAPGAGAGRSDPNAAPCRAPRRRARPGPAPPRPQRVTPPPPSPRRSPASRPRSLPRRRSRSPSTALVALAATSCAAGRAGRTACSMW